MTPPTNFFASYAEALEASERQLAAARSELRVDLLALGAKQVEVEFEGYDDDGNVEAILVSPATVEVTKEMLRRLEDFGWEFALSFFSGLEIGCGSFGSFEWALETDRVDINCCLRDDEAEPETLEDV
ncbi:MAG: DUF6878 family protein [Paracoccaceae bacterium]